MLHVVDISHPRYEEQMGVVGKTLQDLKVDDKPMLVIFNKIDQYEVNTFDPWLEDAVKKEMMEEMRQKWERETHNQCVFVSATEKTNIEQLRKNILDKVKELYLVRYPYKSAQY